MFDEIGEYREGQRSEGKAGFHVHLVWMLFLADGESAGNTVLVGGIPTPLTNVSQVG